MTIIKSKNQRRGVVGGRSPPAGVWGGAPTQFKLKNSTSSNGSGAGYTNGGTDQSKQHVIKGAEHSFRQIKKRNNKARMSESCLKVSNSQNGNRTGANPQFCSILLKSLSKIV